MPQGSTVNTEQLSEYLLKTSKTAQKKPSMKGEVGQTLENNAYWGTPPEPQNQHNESWVSEHAPSPKSHLYVSTYDVSNPGKRTWN